jgi:hypothetical protein
MIKNYGTTRVRFILNNNHEVVTVVKNFRYDPEIDCYGWDEHPAYPEFIQMQDCLVAIVILEVLDPQPCND